MSTRTVSEAIASLASPGSEDEKQQIRDEAKEAVADAMMSAYSLFLNTDLTPDSSMFKAFPETASSSDKLAFMAERSTANICKTASILAIYFMYTRHPELFDQMVILETWDKSVRLNNEHFNYHTYFLVKDITGHFYAGSPANHISEGISPLTKLFDSDELSDIVAGIEQQDGGVWPTAKQIERELAENYQPVHVLVNSRPYLGEDGIEDGTRIVVFLTRIVRTPVGNVSSDVWNESETFPAKKFPNGLSN